MVGQPDPVGEARVEVTLVEEPEEPVEEPDPDEPEAEELALQVDAAEAAVVLPLPDALEPDEVLSEVTNGLREDPPSAALDLKLSVP